MASSEHKTLKRPPVPVNIHQDELQDDEIDILDYIRAMQRWKCLIAFGAGFMISVFMVFLSRSL